MVPEIEIESRHGDVTNIYAVFPDGDKLEIHDGDFIDYINAKKHNISTSSGSDIRDFFKGEIDDAVNHPKHYISHPSGIECIDIAYWYDFSIGNAIKYLWRHGLKHEEGKEDTEKAIEDLEKAKWYIEYKIKKMKETSNAKI